MEVEYNAMKHSLQSIVALMEKEWKHFKKGSIDISYFCFFVDLQEIVGLSDEYFTALEKEENEE